jgi:hypothetical protein
VPKHSALDFAKAILNTVGDGMPYYGKSPAEESLREILVANSIKEPVCPYCHKLWHSSCPHVIHTFNGPVFQER